MRQMISALPPGETQAQLMQSIYSHLPEMGTAVIAALLVGFVLNIAVRFLSALFGDYLYKQYAIASIKTIRAESEDMDYDYRKKGGVNIFLFLLGYNGGAVPARRDSDFYLV